MPFIFLFHYVTWWIIVIILLTPTSSSTVDILQVGAGENSLDEEVVQQGESHTMHREEPDKILYSKRDDANALNGLEDLVRLGRAIPSLDAGAMSANKLYTGQCRHHPHRYGNEDHKDEEKRDHLG